MHSKLHVLTLCKLLNIGLILLLLSACGTSKEDVANPNVLIYKCGAENLVVRDGLEFFESNGLNFKGKNARSQEEVFEGKYSIKLDTINKYGFGTVFTEVQAGEYFEITVWKKSKNDIGNVIAASENGYSFKAKSSSTSIIEEKDGWKKLFLSFTATVDLEKLNVYVFSGGAEAYFDNIEIKRFKERPMLDIPDVSTLEIVIPDDIHAFFLINR